MNAPSAHPGSKPAGHGEGRLSDRLFVKHKEGAALRVKVVPGASHSAIAGVLGDRLKLRVAAPPEGGKANKAVRTLLAACVGLPASALKITSGHARPEKTVLAMQAQPEILRQRLSAYLQKAGPQGHADGQRPHPYAAY